jgi:hypothetical protein
MHNSTLSFYAMDKKHAHCITPHVSVSLKK